MKNVQKRSGAVGNVFLCIQKCIRTDGAPWSEPHIFHTHFKSSATDSTSLHLISFRVHMPARLPRHAPPPPDESLDPGVVSFAARLFGGSKKP